MINKEVIFGLAGLLVGAALGSFVTYKVVKTRLEVAVEEEIIEIKEHYDVVAKKQKTGPYAKLEDLAREYREAQINSYHLALRGLGYASEAEADADPNFDKAAWLAENMGDELNPEWLEENPSKAAEAVASAKWYTATREELTDVDADSDRDDDDEDDTPHIISFEDYSDGKTEFDKISVTYYEGDDVLVDDREEPVADVSYLLGDDALTKFGYKSRDKNVVYVRNPRISSDIEVCRNKDKFSVLVLGLDDPKPPKVRKMRVTE